jgi:hypothetical protein
MLKTRKNVTKSHEKSSGEFSAFLDFVTSAGNKQVVDITALAHAQAGWMSGVAKGDILGIMAFNLSAVAADQLIPKLGSVGEGTKVVLMLPVRG